MYLFVAWRVMRASVRTRPQSACLYSTFTSRTPPTQPGSSPSSSGIESQSSPSPMSSDSAANCTGSASGPRTAGAQREAETHIREHLQNAVLERVPKLGWTSAAVRDALSSLGLSSASKALLPAGPASVVATLEADCNRLLAEHLHARMQRNSPNTSTAGTDDPHITPSMQPLPSTLLSSQAPFTGSTNAAFDNDSMPNPTVSDKVPQVNNHPRPPFTVPDESYNESPSARAAYAMIFRLRLLDPYHQLWYQAVALRARTPRMAFRNRLMLIDEIAAYASYNTPDVSWYADRTVVGAIYQAAELYWIADASPERRDTAHFLRHRLEDAHSLRSSLVSSFTRFMNFRDATLTTAKTFLRASRSSY